MIHRHVWKVVEKVEHPSPMEQMGPREFDLKGYGMSSWFERPVIVTFECSRCETQKVKRV